MRKKHYFSRRDFLRTSAGAMAALGAGRLGLPNRAMAETVRRGGSVTLAVPAAVNTLDPHKVTSHENYPATFHMFSALTRIGHDFGAVPELAESWESSADAKTWTFRIRKNAVFHNGRPVTAEDVKFSLKRVLNPKECPRGYKTIGPITEITAKDPHTVVIRLSKSYVDLPVDLGGIYPRVVDRETLKDINRNPIGCGPFKFKSWEPEGNTVLVGNENYFIKGKDGKPIPYLNQLRIVPIKEPTSQLAGLQTGSVDIMLQFSPDLMETAAKYKNVVVVGAASGYHALHVNLLPPEKSNFSLKEHKNEFTYFKDKRVRQAFAHIFDRKAALQLALRGNGEIGNDQPIPPNHVYGHKNLAARKRDIEKAKRLLTEAGVPKGAEFKLYTTAGRPGLKEVALAFREMAKPAGIDIKVVVVDVSRYFTDMEYKAPFYTDNWGARATIGASVNPFYRTGGGNNCSNLSDPELDKILDAAEGEVNFEKRRGLYWKAMEMISDHAVSIIPYFKKFYQAYSAGLMGVKVHPMTYIWLDRAWKKA